MKYQLSISKEEINQLPSFKFSGEIHLIETKEKALEAALALKGEKILGFDTETRAAFKKGESYPISLLQLATSDKAFLFRLNKFEIIPEIVEILEDPSVIKAGVAVKDDIKGLQKIRPFQEANFIDLAHLAKEHEITNFGLRALTAIMLRKRLSKKAKISNWSREKLTPTQIHYAASDAVVGYNILKKFNEI